MRKPKASLFQYVIIIVSALVVTSCSKTPDVKLCYYDEAGKTIVTQRTTKEMLKSLKKSNWPYKWDESNLRLTVGEISDKVANAIDGPEEMYVVQFERCPEGIVVSEATIVRGKYKTIGTIVSPSHIAQDEPLAMDPSFAVEMPFRLGEYEKK